MTPRTNPARIREALALYDETGSAYAVHKRLGVHHKSVLKWQRERLERGPTWPEPELDQEWHDAQPRRAAVALKARRTRRARYLNRGPLIVDATPTRRRLRALMRLGWSPTAIAEHGPWTTGGRVREILRHPTVTITTRDAVSAVYELLSGTPGPSTRSRRHAERRGWPPPLAWDDIDDLDEVPAVDVEASRCADCRIWQYVDADLVLVGRALAGDRLELNAGERCRAFELGASRGRALAELERVLHTKADRYYHLPRKADAA